MDSYKVFMNFDHHLMDESELDNYIKDWIRLLSMQGYFASQIIQIIFDGPHFRSSFLNEDIYRRIRTSFEQRLTNDPNR
ncbi:hypothetical protein SAMN05216323_104021 [Williamwhitmania taraxaci]|uniref:Uncharacterized protein n=1 Tax=Williamwhitmania taraxaci TaxID=1640674 RepID=A0A1G6N3B6_9BACT|nr:hypothetical protein SAMN05216323_104021 [Williamwhitmania taraxaci]